MEWKTSEIYSCDVANLLLGFPTCMYMSTNENIWSYCFSRSYRIYWAWIERFADDSARRCLRPCHPLHISRLSSAPYIPHRRYIVSLSELLLSPPTALRFAASDASVSSFTFIIIAMGNIIISVHYVFLRFICHSAIPTYCFKSPFD